MLTEFSYPIMCTAKFKETVAYYEDFFDFVPSLEIMDNFVIMERTGWAGLYIAVLNLNNEEVPEGYQTPTTGLILNLPVENVDQAYDCFYFEGLNVISKPKAAICGRKHFFIEDINGNLIDVAQNIPLELVWPHDEDMLMSVPA